MKAQAPVGRNGKSSNGLYSNSIEYVYSNSIEYVSEYKEKENQ